MSEEAGPATIYDVAQRAGVGIATVYRALRGSGSVRAETRLRILRAAHELNFTHSRLGVSLAEGRHAANGIVFPSLTGPYYAEVLLGCATWPGGSTGWSSSGARPPRGGHRACRQR